MSPAAASPGDEVAAAIADSGLTIYDPIGREDPRFYDIGVLEERLRAKLRDLPLHFKNRTRSKQAKIAVSAALGYPVPNAFRKTRPRFPGQDLSVHVQQSNNLQIWNEEVSPERRYVIVIVNAENLVTNVHVLTGETVALLDKTGTLTQKFQASRRTGSEESHLVSKLDTSNFRNLLEPVDALSASVLSQLDPSQKPVVGQVLSVKALYGELLRMVGQRINDPGINQERNRGGALHRLACETLGLARYGDAAQFPDILCQAVEVKLQLSPTIDLGLISPDSAFDAPEVGNSIRHCDVRYAVAYGEPVAENQIEITGVVVATGEDFFTEFRRFEGLVINRKLQIRLPSDFFR